MNELEILPCGGPFGNVHDLETPLGGSPVGSVTEPGSYPSHHADSLMGQARQLVSSEKAVLGILPVKLVGPDSESRQLWTEGVAGTFVPEKHLCIGSCVFAELNVAHTYHIHIHPAVRHFLSVAAALDYVTASNYHPLLCPRTALGLRSQLATMGVSEAAAPDHQVFPQSCWETGPPPCSSLTCRPTIGHPLRSNTR